MSVGSDSDVDCDACDGAVDDGLMWTPVTHWEHRQQKNGANSTLGVVRVECCDSLGHCFWTMTVRPVEGLSVSLQESLATVQSRQSPESRKQEFFAEPGFGSETTVATNGSVVAEHFQSFYYYYYYYYYYY